MPTNFGVPEGRAPACLTRRRSVSGLVGTAVFVASDPARNGPRGERVRVLAAAGAAAGRGSARAAGAGEVGVETVFEALIEFAVATG